MRRCWKPEARGPLCQQIRKIAKNGRFWDKCPKRGRVPPSNIWNKSLSTLLEARVQSIDNPYGPESHHEHCSLNSFKSTSPSHFDSTLKWVIKIRFHSDIGSRAESCEKNTETGIQKHLIIQVTGCSECESGYHLEKIDSGKRYG